MSDRIEGIDSVGRAQRARRVRFADGTERLTSASATKVLSLESGMSLSPAELEASLAQIEPGLAKDRALRLLGYRERSTEELRRRLRDDGFPTHVANDVIASLHSSGLLDDERFAEQLVRSRVLAGYGSRRILKDLLEKGIDRQTAEALVAEAELQAGESEKLRELVAARPPRDRRERESLLRKLVAKGFPPGAVLDALDDTFELREEGESPGDM